MVPFICSCLSYFRSRFNTFPGHASFTEVLTKFYLQNQILLSCCLAEGNKVGQMKELEHNGIAELPLMAWFGLHNLFITGDAWRKSTLSLRLSRHGWECRKTHLFTLKLANVKRKLLRNRKSRTPQCQFSELETVTRLLPARRLNLHPEVAMKDWRHGRGSQKGPV